MHNVAIIGCGIIGLTTATTIQNELKSAVKVTIFTEKLSPNTTSDIAAGLWGPYCVSDTKVEKLQKWGKATHDHLLHLWKNGFASEAGITLQLVKYLSSDRITEKRNYEDIIFGFQTMDVDEIKNFEEQHKKNYKDGCTYVTFTCESQTHLPYLQKIFELNGGVINIKKIEDIDQLSNYDLVINCTGINGKILCKDNYVAPIRGQIARVKAPWQFNTLFSDGTYIIPNCHNVILGGTTQLGDWDTNPRKSDSINILNQTSNVKPSLKNASLLHHIVGLRPGRTEVRLELEMKKVAGKLLPVIHNYGHGGAGVTLSYGCALEVLELIKEVLNSPKKSKL